ncbi:50S ribosomal protein L11 methyltransferase, partial [Fulvivirga sp. RKSG066]|uniref:50S ribosomal protein L11 methyltransferase n=1 Tax=Fulvivirga aurantia TaxID=2529383 RepID=UPI0012BB8FE9
CESDFTEILIAELSELGYDSMMETDNGLEAYIKPVFFNRDSIEALVKKYPQAHITYDIEEVVERNWNEEWEKNYDPIHVDKDILVRATFHKQEPDFPYEIVINPRMSFGTGHHDTTYLMLKNQLGVDHENKRVIDAGCGTGILAIMAEKLGAKEVVAYDNNSWSTENAPENIELNDCNNIEVQEGTIDTINLEGVYDIILANINKNVLLEEMPLYVKNIKSKGHIIFSGFYETDAEDLKSAASQHKLELQHAATRNQWCSLVFRKN